MIHLKDLNSFLTSYLNFDQSKDPSKIDPLMANGLMVKGKEVLTKGGFAVSASLQLFQKAQESGCDFIIVHHSFNFPQVNRFEEIFQNRISYLINNKMCLFGYHFLLDAHPEIGNNVELLKSIDAKPVKPYFIHQAPWGWVGEYQEAKEFNVIRDKLRLHFSPETAIYNYGPAKIKKIAVCSGKGAPGPSEMQELIDENIDLYITGEAHEWNRELFYEAKINFIAGGHYHTEVFGIKALMEKVKKEFPDIKTEWLDLENNV